MCNTQMNQHMQELARLRMMREELDELISQEEEHLKQFMRENDLSELVGEQHKATYKPVSSSRLDTTALKKALPDVAAQFLKTVSSMRFTFA